MAVDISRFLAATALTAISVIIPSRASEPLQERLIERRAVEAVIWGMPLVNFDAMRQAYFRDAGAKYNDIMYWSKPSDWRNQTTTPNHSTSYVLFFVNLKDGPVVIDVPPAGEVALYGALLDSWTRPLINVGSLGDDKGKGAKYLLLPPGYEGTPPAGYVPVRHATYNGYTLLRVITKTLSDADLARGVTGLKELKVYPVAQARSPAPNRFIDMADTLYDALPAFDSSYFTSLARMVEEEPLQREDLAIMGQLRSLDIGKGLRFQPDAQRKTILQRAAAEAHAYLMEGYAASGSTVWPNHRWRTLADRDLAARTRLTFVDPERGIRLDERAFAWFAMFGPIVPPGPHVYMKTYETGSGEPLNGTNAYRLRIPAHVPAEHFWAINVYDARTGAFIREAAVVGQDSYNRKLKTNADGSIDLYFAPQAPAGHGDNWITTSKGQRFFVMFRIYGPLPALREQTWRLNDLERLQ